MPLDPGVMSGIGQGLNNIANQLLQKEAYKHQLDLLKAKADLDLESSQKLDQMALGREIALKGVAQNMQKEQSIQVGKALRQRLMESNAPKQLEKMNPILNMLESGMPMDQIDVLVKSSQTGGLTSNRAQEVHAGLSVADVIRDNEITLEDVRTNPNLAKQLLPTILDEYKKRGGRNANADVYEMLGIMTPALEGRTKSWNARRARDYVQAVQRLFGPDVDPAKLTPEQSAQVEARAQAEHGEDVSQTTRARESEKYRQKSRDVLATFKTSDNMLQQIEDLADKIVTAQTPQDIPKQYLEGKIGGITKFNPDAAAYLDTVKSFGSMLTRAAGEKGVLTQLDVDKILNALPKLTDTVDSKNKKLKMLRGLYGAIKTSSIEAYTMDIDKVISQAREPNRAGSPPPMKGKTKGQLKRNSDTGEVWKWSGSKWEMTE